MFLGVLHDSSYPNKHFMDVDFLAYHDYVACEEEKTSDDDIWNQFVSANANFNGLIKKWNGQGMNIKGLWMTEVSCGNRVDGSWSRPCGDTYNSNTMNQFMRLIQKHPEIKSWAWFPSDAFYEFVGQEQWLRFDRSGRRVLWQLQSCYSFKRYLHPSVSRV